MSKKVYVGNLSYNATEDSVKEPLLSLEKYYQSG